MYGENLKHTKIKFVIYTIYYGINKIDNVLYIKYVICNIYVWYILYITYYGKIMFHAEYMIHII